MRSGSEGVRPLFFPGGLGLINRTYLEESGEVEMAKSRLTEADWAALEGIPAMGGTLKDVVESWIATGAALGDLERKRSRLVEESDAAEHVSRSDVVSARNQWIRVVHAILAGLELAESVDEETLRLILQPLEDAVRKAVSKSAAKSSASEDQAVAS